MDLSQFLVSASGPGPTLIGAILAVLFTILILRWPAGIAYIQARLAEPSSQGSLVFASNAFYGLISGTMPGQTVAIILLQCTYHVLMPEGLRAQLPPVVPPPENQSPLTDQPEKST